MKAYAFDRYELRVAERRLLRDGTPVALPTKCLELLEILVEARGGAVSREYLYERLWPEGFVEDGNLTQTVYMLRRVLDPVRSGRRFIETLPKHGYRFAIPVEEIAPKLVYNSRRPRLRYIAAACLAAFTLLLAGTTIQSETAPLRSDAATAYALGVFHWNMRTESELKRSIQYFAQTVQESPDSPLGYAGLANAYVIQADGSDKGSATERRDLTFAERYRDEALARDPNNCEALTVAAFIAERFYGDRHLAELYYRRALDVNPRYATAHHWHAILRFSKGDIGGAVAEWEEAHRLEPTSEVIARWLGVGYFYAHRPERAIAILGETLALQPQDADAWLNLSAAKEQRGDYRGALAALVQLRKIMPHKLAYTMPLEARIYALQHHGTVSESTVLRVRALAAKTHYKEEGSVFAYFFAAIGRPDEAIAQLQKSHSTSHDPENDLEIWMLRLDPRLQGLHNDTRFRKMFFN